MHMHMHMLHMHMTCCTVLSVDPGADARERDGPRPGALPPVSTLIELQEE